ncbi:MAG: ATP-dependent Clp protease ATP-binding subunit ClpC, partial [Bacillota bacterium]|nr:ATP-dependent Clp protease ATP-binding subunit ClpC [Bacillota bacterium]
SIVFHVLNPEHIREIVELMLEDVEERMEENAIDIEFTDAVKDLLADKGYDEKFGARPLRRTIQRLIEDRLSEELLKGTFKDGKRVVIGATDTGDVTITPAPHES